jgi:YD repeat-containing protein
VSSAPLSPTIDTPDDGTTTGLSQILVTATDPGGNVTRYAYDGLGHQVAITNANGVRTSYVYDDLGRQVAVVENDTGEAQTSGSNVRTEYLNDALGHPVCAGRTGGS